MKTTLWFLLVVLNIGFLNAQSGGAERTTALLSLEEYKKNPLNNENLRKAKKHIDNAVADSKAGDEPKTWRKKAEIYSFIANDKELTEEYNNAATEAYDAIEKALSMEEAKAEVKGKPKSKIAAKLEFREIFSLVVNALYRQGIQNYNARKWESAYNQLSRLTQVPARTAGFDTKKQITTTFTSGDEEIDMVLMSSHFAGLAAVNLEKMDEAEKMLMPLIKDDKLSEKDAKFAYSRLANGYFKVNNAKDAKRILKTARETYPADYDLLIAEINIALSEGRLAELEEELKLAVDKDPDNAELLFVLGNMYDELFRKKIDLDKKEISDEDFKQGKEFFAKAVNWYKKAVAKDAAHFNSLYSIGAIYVNFSGSYATLLQDDKLDDELRKKYEAAYDKNLDDGLVYLLKAEKVKPNDIGLIRALKEVYSRKSDDSNWKKYNEKEKAILNSNKG